jgi:hypothetical protein
VTKTDLEDKDSKKEKDDVEEEDEDDDWEKSSTHWVGTFEQLSDEMPHWQIDFWHVDTRVIEAEDEMLKMIDSNDVSHFHELSESRVMTFHVSRFVFFVSYFRDLHSNSSSKVSRS